MSIYYINLFHLLLRPSYLDYKLRSPNFHHVKKSNTFFLLEMATFAHFFLDMLTLGFFNADGKKI